MCTSRVQPCSQAYHPRLLSWLPLLVPRCPCTGTSSLLSLALVDLYRAQWAQQASRLPMSSKTSKARGTHRHVDAETQAKIVQYACEQGNKAAVEHFLGFDIKKTSASTWKMKYLAEVKRRVKTGESAADVKRLPVKKRGRPLLTGEKLDGELKAYIRAVSIWVELLLLLLPLQLVGQCGCLLCLQWLVGHSFCSNGSWGISLKKWNTKGWTTIH